MSSDGRFAPSPTGTLHVGNLRTALLAWLFARTAGARFLVRMEDLDQGRVIAGSAEQQLDDLRALGLDWDGEVVFQSNRHDAYEAAIERLLAAGRLYECFCTRAEIRAAASAPHGPLPEGAYPGTCLRLTPAERRRKRAGGRPPALRVRADGARIGFDDRVHGPQEGVVDDFVVRRNDGAPAYNLAVIVDDAWQGIGEVVRGDDLLDSTPRQLFLAEALGPAAARVRARAARARRRTARGSPSATARSRSASSSRARSCAGWRRRWASTARRPRPRCASASTPRRCRASRRAGSDCRADATFRRVRRRLSGPLLLVVAVAALLVLLPTLIPALNPFKEETVDRSGPVLLKSLENLSEYRAASANMQVVVDVEQDTDLVPSFIKGERTLFVAAGPSTPPWTSAGSGARPTPCGCPTTARRWRSRCRRRS